MMSYDVLLSVSLQRLVCQLVGGDRSVLGPPLQMAYSHQKGAVATRLWGLAGNWTRPYLLVCMIRLVASVLLGFVPIEVIVVSLVNAQYVYLSAFLSGQGEKGNRGFFVSTGRSLPSCQQNSCLGDCRHR